MNKDTQLGYCCINLNLRQIPITVNRTCRKATFQSGGLPYVSNLALQNIRDLVEIIKWNEKNGFKVYRMSSNMFPWMSEYELKDLPDYRKISTILKGAGRLAIKYGQRLSFHPGPFNVLGSPNPVLVTKTTKELNQTAEIMDIMGLEQSNHYPINIHCNGVYGDKKATLQRWSDNYKNLSVSAQARLVVENDDKASMYSVKDLYDGIFSEVWNLISDFSEGCQYRFIRHTSLISGRAGSFFQLANRFFPGKRDTKTRLTIKLKMPKILSGPESRARANATPDPLEFSFERK